jgi:hypothetical protein
MANRSNGTRLFHTKAVSEWVTQGEMTMATLKHNSKKEVENYYRVAYQVADDFQEDVFIIWEPRSGMEYHPGLTYIVPASSADQWEVTNGEKIQWRHK